MPAAIDSNRTKQSALAAVNSFFFGRGLKPVSRKQEPLRDELLSINLLEERARALAAALPSILLGALPRASSRGLKTTAAF